MDKRTLLQTLRTARPILYQIDLGYACAGVVVRAGLVIEAAPIFRWAIGKSWVYFESWVRGMGGTVTRT